MTNNRIAHLSVAEVPAKEDLLALIEELRTGVENGEILSIVAIPIYTSRTWHRDLVVAGLKQQQSAGRTP